MNAKIKKNVLMDTNSNPCPKSIEIVQSHARRGDFVEALNQAERLIRHYPDWHQGHTLAITCCRRLKKTDQEIQFAALGTCSVQDGRHLFLAHAFETFMRHDKFYMALTIGKEYARSNRRDPKHLVKEVFALIALGKCKKAAQTSRDLLKEFPEDEIVLECAAKSFKATNNTQEAISTYNKLIRISNNNWNFYDQLITLLLENGKNKRAQKLCAKSYARNQEQPKDANRCEPVIQVMQYFHSIRPRDGQNDKANHYKIINQKIKLQWQSSLQGNGSYQLIGREEAAANIQKWYGNHAKTLFNCCALPAMQADFLRVAFLAQHNNALYIDWPHRPIHPEGLLAESHIQKGKSLLATRLRGGEQRLWNGFAFNSAKSDISTYFQAVLEKIMDNIEHRVSNNVWVVTGPGAWIDVLKQFKEQDSVIDYIVFPEDFKKYFQPAFDKRKNLQDHWSVKQESQSIFLND
tara:strand:+ start:390 stop:1778 length:1389 start_codon:yes stop_codon:yes gene_type:complete